MMVADSLHVAVHFLVLSDVATLWSPSCRRVCRVGANPVHWTLQAARHPAQPSHVQASCLERAWPAVPSVSICAFAGGLAASSTAPPGRRRRERKRQTKAEGKTKGGGTQPPEKSVCTWGWRGTMRIRRRAAWGAKPAPRRGWPRASCDRPRHNFGQRLQGELP